MNYNLDLCYALFVLKRMEEEFRKKKSLFISFVDLEKVFDNC